MILNKFAAGVVATAIGLTAISAPVKANDDIGKLLALLAGGYVVSEIIKDKKEDKRVVKRTPIPGVYDPKPRKHLKLPMPKTCRRRIHLRNAKSIRAMSQRCLLNHSYYISETGAVTHPRYPSRYAYPNLVQ